MQKKHLKQQVRAHTLWQNAQGMIYPDHALLEVWGRQ